MKHNLNFTSDDDLVKSVMKYILSFTGDDDLVKSVMLRSEIHMFTKSVFLLFCSMYSVFLMSTCLTFIRFDLYIVKQHLVLERIFVVMKYPNTSHRSKSGAKPKGSQSVDCR